ncbi:MAG: 4Fe-4S dicluster domain-containing protein [Clostridia bacterium]|nr:4Fe-4S dicluster domain-containing protein [Clostridia bacterium]
MTIEELQKIVYNAGIVGAGGAGFPTHRKFSDKVEQIVVNAAECEPLMMVDHHLLEYHLSEIAEALNVMCDAMGAKEVLIGIKGKNMHLLDKDVVRSFRGTRIKIKEIPDVYPAGDEVMLTYETTGKIIPEGAIPIMVGVMVINVETVFNIYKALKNAEPVTEKYITIGGDVPEDITVVAPMGMKIKDLLNSVGYGNLEGKSVVNGGPMMGALVDIENDVVTKTTKGLLIFPTTHGVIQRMKQPVGVSMKRASAACCNCTMCTDLCPRYLLGYNLEVHKTVRAASHGEVKNTEAFLQNALCCGCGVCSVIACQQGLFPSKLSMEIKGALGKYGLRRENNVQPESARPERASRLISSNKLIDRLGIRRFVKKSVKKVDTVFTPDTVYIQLKQHVGKPATATVKVGDKVKAGDVVALTAYEDLGTVMHSSINGTVKEVTDRFVIIGK